nr:PREDICTED: uncharacterized protein LOC107983756 [Anolis carolinensis]|eukprot:XP_016854232.1 PREDICTED: uncharacterized protein LOC107983756 [Anolis carolinensis]
MTPHLLWVLLGPLLLCKATLAAPHKATPGMPSLSNGNDPEMHRQNWATSGNGETKDWTEEEMEPACLEEASIAKRGDGLHSKGTRPSLSEEPTSLRDFISKLLAKLGCPGSKNVTSGETPGPDGKAASNHSQHGQLVSGNKTVSGNTTHGKLVSGEKPICGGNPGSSGVGHGASCAGQAEHGKTPKPAPHGKPEKPKLEDDPEKDKDDDDAGEKDLVGDDDNDDIDEHVEDDTGKGSSDADEDAFDKELDYGLNKSPFDAYAYHDAWSDDEEDLEEEEGSFPKESFDFSAMKTVLDIWGDILTKPKPEEEATLLNEGVGYNGERPVFDIWGDIVAKPKS